MRFSLISLPVHVGIVRLFCNVTKKIKPQRRVFNMKTLQLNEVSLVVEEWKKGFLKARTLKSEITIKSNCNQSRYRLMFKRTNRRDSGKFYLMSSDQSFQLHDLVLHSLLVNIKRGNYDILSAFSIFENGSFEESDQISIQSNNQRGEIK